MLHRYSFAEATQSCFLEINIPLTPEEKSLRLISVCEKGISNEITFAFYFTTAEGICRLFQRQLKYSLY